MTKIYNPLTKDYFEEKVFGAKAINLIYNNWALRKLFANTILQKLVSKAYGLFQKTIFSKPAVAKFVDNFGISLEDYEVPSGGFESFNDFFIRKKKNATELFNKDKTLFLSSCDARLSVYKIDKEETMLFVKGKTVPLEELLIYKNLSKEFANGYAWVFRLCPVDYHRFHFPDSGKATKATRIAGKLHSVNPLSLEKIPKVFLENERQLTQFYSQNFGKILFLEVGAMCVGTIVQSYEPATEVSAGQEKGYFEFGGSTQIIITSDKTVPNIELLNQTAKGFESLVSLGMPIGKLNYVDAFKS